MQKHRIENVQETGNWLQRRIGREGFKLREKGGNDIGFEIQRYYRRWRNYEFWSKYGGKNFGINVWDRLDRFIEGAK